MLPGAAKPRKYVCLGLLFFQLRRRRTRLARPAVVSLAAAICVLSYARVRRDAALLHGNCRRVGVLCTVCSQFIGSCHTHARSRRKHIAFWPRRTMLTARRTDDITTLSCFPKSHRPPYTQVLRQRNTILTFVVYRNLNVSTTTGEDDRASRHSPLPTLETAAATPGVVQMMTASASDDEHQRTECVGENAKNVRDHPLCTGRVNINSNVGSDPLPDLLARKGAQDRLEHEHHSKVSRTAVFRFHSTWTNGMPFFRARLKDRKLLLCRHRALFQWRAFSWGGVECSVQCFMLSASEFLSALSNRLS